MNLDFGDRQEIKLRWYQSESVKYTFDYLKKYKDRNPCIVLPTGAGKTIVMAEICKKAMQWGRRVLILAHVKELLSQTYGKICEYCPEADVGLYSAGLGRRDLGNQIIVGGIQSVFNKAWDMGPFDLIIIDEMHLIPVETEGRYNTFLNQAREVNKAVRLVGLTATPYRLKGGYVYGEDNLFNDISYEVGVRKLIEEGYLCKLSCKASIHKFDDAGLHTKMGEFIDAELDEKLNKEEVIRAACEEIDEYTKYRHKVLVFCVNIDHCEKVRKELQQYGTTGSLHSRTSPGERDRQIWSFKNGHIKFFCNVNILSTGFDAPDVDCIVMLRPTKSAGLYYQQVGRGFRLFPTKEDCLVLDYAGNIMRLGPVDMIVPKKKGSGDGEAPAKICPQCQEVVSISLTLCPACGFVFPIKEDVPHSSKASMDMIISEEISKRVKVSEMLLRKHVKKYPDGSSKNMVKATYYGNYLEGDRYNYFITIEHSGYAREKALIWIKKHFAVNVPNLALINGTITADTIINSIQHFKTPCEILVKKRVGAKYWEIVDFFFLEQGKIDFTETEKSEYLEKFF